MLNLKHKNLDVWKVSIDFVSAVYRLTESFPSTELYGITNQMRRAAVSVPSNIAEGSSRSSAKERSRFYEIGRSSIAEVDTQVEIAKRLEYCSDEDLEGLSKEINHLFALLSRLIKTTK